MSNFLLLEAFELEEALDKINILKDKIKNDFISYMQDSLRRFNKAEKKENGKEVFIPPITIASIYELTGDKIENDYRNNTDLPFVAVECQLKINNAYTGTKLGWLIKSFSDKMFGDSTSGLRSYSKAIKTSLIIDDSVRYEVAEIRNPELRIDNSRNIISTNENEYRFIIILRPVKRRIK